MKTFKQIIKETWSTPPDAPQHSAYYSSALQSKSKLDFKSGVYIPPVSRLPTEKSLHSSPDSRAFDNEKDALDYVTSRVAHPDDKDMSHEHSMGVQYNPNTDGSYKWVATNQLSGKEFSAGAEGKSGQGTKIDGRTGAKEPNKLYHLVHNHPLTTDNDSQKDIAKYFSTNDTHVPVSVSGGKNIRDDGKPLNMRLVYPSEKSASSTGGRGWGVSDYTAGKDKLVTVRVDRNNTFDNMSLGHPADYGTSSSGVKTAAAPWETSHEIEPSDKKLYASNEGRGVKESIVASFLNKRKTGII